MTLISLAVLPLPLSLKKDEEALLVSFLGSSESSSLRAMQAQEKRYEFLLGHALARFQLAKKSNLHPKKIELLWEKFTLPRVKDLPELGKIYLSISHRQGFVAVATSSVRIGVDIEQTIQKDLLYMDALRNYFSQKEQGLFDDVPDKLKAFWYAQRWALKEALYKAHQGDITEVFRNTSMLKRETGMWYFESDLADLKADQWQLSLLNPHPERVLALAYENSERLPIEESFIPPQDLIGYLKNF